MSKTTPADDSREAQSSLRRLHHELRTPLGQIIGYAEMLDEEVRDRGEDDLVGDIQKIREAAQSLLSVVGEVFGTPMASESGGRSIAATEGKTELAQDEPPIVPEDVAGRILVVDDEPNNRDLLSRRLERLGFDVTSVADGRSALHEVEKSSFDLVMLDVMMPGMSGIEVLVALRETRSSAQLPVIMASALDAREDIVAALKAGANDYVTKPLDFPIVLARVQAAMTLRKTAAQAESLTAQLAFRNAAIRRTFGRYVSDEVVTAVLEQPEGLELRGEKREVTLLMCDLRGFSVLTESHEPVEIVWLLNTFLGAMCDVIQDHLGTIDEFFGDAILAFFGAPIARDDDCERAAACAIAMQQAMVGINSACRERGLPEVEMGIAIATGEVIVGNIGSEKRTKYGAIGSTVNLVSRIESYTLGGEIWVSSESRNRVGGIMQIASERQVHPKGVDAPIQIHRLVGLGGSYNVKLPETVSEWVELAVELPIRFSLLAGKDVTGEIRTGYFEALSSNAARMRTDCEIAEMSDIRIEFTDGQSGTSYAKVVSASPSDDEASTIRFTNQTPDFASRLRLALAEAPGGEPSR